MKATMKFEGVEYTVKASDQVYGSGRFQKRFVDVQEVGSQKAVKGIWLTEQGGWDTGKQPVSHKFGYFVAKSLNFAGPAYQKQAQAAGWE